MKLKLVKNFSIFEGQDERQRQLIPQYYPGQLILLKHNLSEITPTVKPEAEAGQYTSTEKLANQNHIFLVTSVDYTDKTFDASILTSKYNQKSEASKKQWFPVTDYTNTALDADAAKEGIAINLEKSVVGLPFNAGFKSIGQIPDAVLSDFFRARIMAAAKGMQLKMFESRKRQK